MGDAGVLAGDGGLAMELAAALEPKLQGALNHPTRRAVLRALHAGNGPRSVTEILDDLPLLTRGEVSYHAQVLLDSGCVVVEGTRPAPGGEERQFRSVIASCDQATLVLRATERSDRERRMREIEPASPDPRRMFPVPRRSRTVRLRRRQGREAEQNR